MSDLAHLEGGKELDYRAADGVEVALVWHPSTNHVSVRVLDARAGHTFELVLSEDDDALDVFEHPYAYATHRGVVFEPSGLLELAAA